MTTDDVPVMVPPVITVAIVLLFVTIFAVPPPANVMPTPVLAANAAAAAFTVDEFISSAVILTVFEDRTLLVTAVSTVLPIVVFAVEIAIEIALPTRPIDAAIDAAATRDVTVDVSFACTVIELDAVIVLVSTSLLTA